MSMLDFQSVGIYTSNPIEIPVFKYLNSAVLAIMAWLSLQSFNRPSLTIPQTYCYSSPPFITPFLAGGHDASEQGIQFLKSSRGMPRILRTVRTRSLDIDKKSGRAVKGTTILQKGGSEWILLVRRECKKISHRLERFPTKGCVA